LALVFIVDMKNETPNTTIYIVEDDPVLSLILNRMVQKMNYSVVGNSESGKESISKITELKPGIVLMDISLKDDIDGTMVASEIVKAYNPTIIYITGNSDAKNKRKAEKSGYHDYLIKPISFDQLKESIETSLDK